MSRPFTYNTMSYNLFRPDRFLCEQELSPYAFHFKGPTVEFTNPATANGIADNITIPGRYFLAKTVVAFTGKPGLKIESVTGYPGVDFDISWTYGCPHRCVYCNECHLCINYPYISIYPKIEEIEMAIREIAVNWQEKRPFVCRVGNMTDILALEHLTGWLSRLVLLFANEIAPHGQLHFLTRSSNFAPLAELNHRRATRVGISIVPEPQVRDMEPGTASLAARLDLLNRAISSGYPVHISMSPVMLSGDYERTYERFFEQLANKLLQAGLPETIDLSVDITMYYIRPECEAVIDELAPQVRQDMVSRRVEGRARLTYPEEVLEKAQRYFRRMLPQYLPNARLLFIR